MIVDNNFTIIIPTYEEAENIPELAKRISQVNFGGRCFEVILVDDNSADGTVDVVKHLSKQYPWLKLVVRQAKRDLSRSILDGFSHASYPILITMDADLSHPPEKIPEMLELLSQPGVDVVLGSRYLPGGSTDVKWPFTRKLISRLGALMANWLILSDVRDPLSGFLAIRQQTFMTGETLKPIGWKIGLEIMVKCHCKNIREVPIHFSDRYEKNDEL